MKVDNRVAGSLDTTTEPEKTGNSTKDMSL